MDSHAAKLNVARTKGENGTKINLDGGKPFFLIFKGIAGSGPPPAVDAASAVRTKDLLYCTALVPGVSFTGPVLLVDTPFVRGGQRP
jgi:hypothetical protein